MKQKAKMHFIFNYATKHSQFALRKKICNKRTNKKLLVCKKNITHKRSASKSTGLPDLTALKLS